MAEATQTDFSEFYDEWFDRVYSYARSRTGSPVRADEIAADTFSRALNSWPRFDPGKADRRTWLFSIAFRSVADHYRGQSRRLSEPLDLLPEQRDKGGGPPQELEDAQDQKELSAALARLEDQQREIVSLRFFAGMTNRAIAGLMGLTEQNVGVILFRAIRSMRKSFPGVEA